MTPAYQMARQLFENRDRPGSRPTRPGVRSSWKNALNGMPVPLHPGAERYYREVGLIK